MYSKIGLFILNLIRCSSFLVVIGNNDEVLKYKRQLPCGCILHWNEIETLITFCVPHSFDYMRWTGNDEEFIKRVTNTQREIRYVDENILVKMR